MAEPREEIVGHGEVHQALERADVVGQDPGQLVVSQVHDLDLGEARDGVRQVTHQRIVARIEHLHVREQPDPLGDAPGELIVQEQDLSDLVAAHEAESGRDASTEPVVGQIDHRGPRASQCLRQIAIEAVVVKQDCIKLAIFEELGWDWPREAVVPEIKVEQAGHVKDRAWECA